jgi:hypothetical protein
MTPFQLAFGIRPTHEMFVSWAFRPDCQSVVTVKTDPFGPERVIAK